jgi:hypothetical protein
MAVSYRFVRRLGIMHLHLAWGTIEAPMESGHQIEASNIAFFRHRYDCEHDARTEQTELTGGAMT